MLTSSVSSSLKFMSKEKEMHDENIWNNIPSKYTV